MDKCEISLDKQLMGHILETLLSLYITRCFSYIKWVKKKFIAEQVKKKSIKMFNNKMNDLSSGTTDEKLTTLLVNWKDFDELTFKIDALNSQVTAFNGNISELADDASSLEKRIEKIEVANLKTKNSMDYLLNTNTKK